MTPLEKLAIARAAQAQRQAVERRDEMVAQHSWLKTGHILRTLRCENCYVALQKQDVVFFCEAQLGEIGLYEARYCCALCASGPAWRSICLARGGMARGSL